jgi:hypothetical protein
MNDPCIDPRTCLDEEQVRALIDLESVTHQSLGAMIREGIAMYIKVKKGEASYRTEIDTMLSPIVFEPPYRKTPGQ